MRFCTTVNACPLRALHNQTLPVFPKEKPPFVPRPPLDPHADRIKVLHLSDWHYDPEYQVVGCYCFKSIIKILLIRMYLNCSGLDTSNLVHACRWVPKPIAQIPFVVGYPHHRKQQHRTIQGAYCLVITQWILFSCLGMQLKYLQISFVTVNLTSPDFLLFS